MNNLLGQLLLASGQLPGAPALPARKPRPNIQLEEIPKASPRVPIETLGELRGNIRSGLNNMSPEAGTALQVFGMSLLDNQSLGGSGLKAIQTLKGLKDQKEAKTKEEARYAEGQRQRVNDRNLDSIDRASERSYRIGRDAKTDSNDAEDRALRRSALGLQREQLGLEKNNPARRMLEAKLNFLANKFPQMSEDDRYVLLDHLETVAKAGTKTKAEARAKMTNATLGKLLESRELGSGPVTPVELATMTQQAEAISNQILPDDPPETSFMSAGKEHTLGQPAPVQLNPDRTSNTLFVPPTAPAQGPVQQGPVTPLGTPPPPKIGGTIELKNPATGQSMLVAVTPIDAMSSMVKLPNGRTMAVSNQELMALQGNMIPGAAPGGMPA